MRIRDIVEAYTTWRDARFAAMDAAGMPDAEDAVEKAHRNCVKVMLEIVECPATTLAGVMMKARAAVQCFGDTLEEAEAGIDDEINAGSCAESLALSIVKDLARMAPGSAMGGANA